MATKWKNFTRSSWVKAAAWLLSLVMAGVMTLEIVSFANTMQSSDSSFLDPEMLVNEKVTSSFLAQKLGSQSHELLRRADFSDETAIRNGNLVDEVELYYDIYTSFRDTCYAVDDTEDMDDAVSLFTIAPAEEGSPNYLTDEKIDEIIAYVHRRDITGGPNETKNFRIWLGYNRGIYNECLQKQISIQLQQMREFAQTDLPSDMDYYVYQKKLNAVLTNFSDKTMTPEQAAKRFTTANYRMICVQSNGSCKFYDDTVEYDILENLNVEFSYYNDDEFPNSIAYIAIKPSDLAELQQNWSDMRFYLLRIIGVEVIGGLVLLLCFILLCFGVGRKPNDAEKYLVGYDKIWSEVLYMLYGCAIAAWVAPICIVIDNWIYLTDLSKNIILCGTTILFIAASYLFFFSQLRRLKAKKWLEGWLLWKLFRKFVIASLLYLHHQLRKSPLCRKIILISIGVPVCIFLCTFFFIILFGAPEAGIFFAFLLLAAMAAGAIYFGIRAADRFAAITHTAKDIRSGKTDTHITLHGGGPEINGLADDLNYISEGLQDAVSTAVKSERLKSELISNVSHDIKTPLTSIITYIDLLKKCNINDPAAQEYLSILEQKAQRLTMLTTDLFDASKATSGAMQVDLMQTDFDALLRQALGERSEDIKKAGLDIRIQSSSPSYIVADGRLLWRILDNIIANCTRYAMPNSRVYITIQPFGEYVEFTMKNISAHELNISAEELMQRFTRGDRSRHTEGSGLGLSIAQSLAELMHGSCYVEIDGDLFKAIVRIPKWHEITSNP